ncbi:hypothetical protein PT2222_30165 [Paraburkholderia tropica]
MFKRFKPSRHTNCALLRRAAHSCKEGPAAQAAAFVRAHERGRPAYERRSEHRLGLTQDLVANLLRGGVLEAAAGQVELLTAACRENAVAALLIAAIAGGCAAGQFAEQRVFDVARGVGIQVIVLDAVLQHTRDVAETARGDRRSREGTAEAAEVAERARSRTAVAALVEQIAELRLGGAPRREQRGDGHAGGYQQSMQSKRPVRAGVARC